MSIYLAGVVIGIRVCASRVCLQQGPSEQVDESSDPYRMWIALILLSLAALAGALRPVAPKLERRSRWMPALRLDKGSGSGDDFDSSGMTAMSSSEIKEIKMKQQLEAEKKEEEMISSILKKSFELNAKVKSDIAGKSKPTKAATPTPVSYTHLTLPTICSV